MLNRKKAKHAEPKYTMPYNERIREYNREKQVALLGCETTEQVERVVEYLRKKWNV